MRFIDSIGVGASAAAIGGAFYASGTYVKGKYDATLGSRRLVAKKLNQLAVGTTRSYVESLLGVPVFERETTLGVHDYVYRTPHAWIGTQHGSRGVQAFSITVTDPKFKFRTDGLTFGNVDIVLGRSPITAISTQPAGRQVAVGANRFTFAESYYFGNPANYQHFVFSHSQAGCGEFTFGPLQTADVPLPILDGDLSEGIVNTPVRDYTGLEDSRSRTIVNTLVVGAYFASSRQLGAGVDYGVVRALPG